MFSIQHFSLQYQFIQHMLFPVSCCSLCTRHTHNKHIRHNGVTVHAIRLQDIRAMFWTLPQYMLKSLLYWVLSDSLISLIVWYYCVDTDKFYIQSHVANLMNLRNVSYDILRYVWLQEHRQKLKFYSVRNVLQIRVPFVYVIGWSCKEPMEYKLCLFSFLYLHQLPNKALRLDE